MAQHRLSHKALLESAIRPFSAALQASRSSEERGLISRSGTRQGAGSTHLTQSLGSSSGRRQPGAGTARYSSCSPAAPPRWIPLPPLLPPPPPLPRCLPPPTLASCWYPSGTEHNKWHYSSSLYPANTSPLSSTPSPWRNWALRISYLPVVDARMHFSLDASIICWIHPEQELPAAGERNSKGVEDLL